MKAIRARVSGSRVRYTQDGFDLDLTYITERLVAMGYPASGVEKTYRNDINEVAAFLDSRHRGAYRVYNLSERKYDYAKFGHAVKECGFPDHHPPPLPLLLEIMNDMLAWTASDPTHIVVVHCLAGKGRTGVVCSCFLLLTGFYGDLMALRSDRELREIANHAIKDFWLARGQGVRYPSQALYIYYFARVVRRLRRMPLQIPPMRVAKRMMLKRVVLHGIPDYDAPPRGGCTPFLQVLKAPSQAEKQQLLYNSSWQNPNFETYAADPSLSIEFETNCVIQGDIMIRCFHANAFSVLGRHVVQMFHVTFNTDFFHRKCDLYRLPKREIDEAHDNSRFPSTFHLYCHVEPLTSVDEDADDDDDEVDGRALIGRRTMDDERDRASTASTASMESHGRRSAQERQSLDVHRAASMPRRRPSEQNAPMMGWLYKQGGFVKSWKKRWFVARDGQLTYYSNVSDPTPLGAVDLHGVSVDTCLAEETTAKNQFLHYFKIIPRRRDQRTWYFGAESEAEMSKWISALAAQACHGIDPYATALSDPGRGRASQRSAGSIGSSSGVRRSEPSFGLTRGSTFSTGANRASVSSFVSDVQSSSHWAAAPNDTRLHGTATTTADFAASNAAVRGSFGPVGFSRSPPDNGRRIRMDQIAQVNAASAMFPNGDPDLLSLDRGSSRKISTGSVDDDDDDHFTSSSNAPLYVMSKPVDTRMPLSEQDRLTVLHEVAQDFQSGTYIYTADELHTAARLQQYVKTTTVPASESSRERRNVTIAERLRDAIANGQRGFAEQLLLEVIMLNNFSTLVDAMEYNPVEFMEMIVGVSVQRDGGAGGGTAYRSDAGAGASAAAARLVTSPVGSVPPPPRYHSGGGVEL
ncbi:hypothetical protein PINS_up002633 [Pythium insidiosum]|nr:hypothetical protein PINS_up002633 [Pythium insidiosum]